MTEEHMRLVNRIVQAEKRKLGRGNSINTEEIRSFAFEGLAFALNRYDTDHKASFSSYAIPRIRGAIYDGLCQAGWFPRRLQRKISFYRKSEAIIESSYTSNCAPKDKVEAVNKLAGTLRELATAYVTTYVAEGGQEPAAKTVNADVALEQKRLKEKIMACIETLPSKQRSIVYEYFFNELTLEEIGQKMGITRSWASKLLNAGLDKIGKSFGKKNVRTAIDAFHSPKEF